MMDNPTAALHAVAALPWYFKILGALGVLGFFWKMVQSNVPKLLDLLLPIALRLTDAFVALVLTQPLLRWMVLGDKDNFLATVNALLDGLEKISDAVQARLKADLDAATNAGPTSPSDPPPPPAAPPA
jgi:hypothetical protein